MFGLGFRLGFRLGIGFGFGFWLGFGLLVWHLSVWLLVNYVVVSVLKWRVMDS